MFDKTSKEYDEPQYIPSSSAKTPKTPLTNDMKALIKTEVAKNFGEIQKELSPEALKIVNDLALGFSDAQIIDKHEIDEETLTTYYNNPTFNSELNKQVYNAGHASDVMRVRGMNRVLGDALQEIMTRDNFFQGIPAEKLLDLYMKGNLQMDKMIRGDKPSVIMDVTQIITNNIKNINRVTADNNGEIIIESEYPVLGDEVTDVEPNAEGNYE